MLWPPSERVTAVRTAAGSAEEAFVVQRALQQGTWRSGAAVLKESAGGCVFEAQIAGKSYVLKTHPVRTLQDRVRSSLGRSKLARQWRGAEILTTIGVRTAAPVLLARGLDESGELLEVLVIECLQGKSLLEHLRDDDLDANEQRLLTESMAVDLEAMWLRAFNRDHKPSNLIVVPDDDRGLRCAVVDTVGVRALRGVRAGSDHKLARMLASLYIEPLGTGCAPEVLCWYRLVCRLCDAPQPKGKRKPGWSTRAAFGFARTLAGRAGRIVNEHGDPTPKDNPFPTRSAIGDRRYGRRQGLLAVPEGHYQPVLRAP